MSDLRNLKGRTFDGAHVYEDPTTESPDSYTGRAQVLRSFASLRDLATYAKGPGHGGSSTGEGYGGNNGTWADVHALVATGWHAPRAEVDRIVDSVRESVRPFVTSDFSPVYDVSGAEVDIDRFLTGEPENMIEQVFAPTLKHGRVVRVLAAIGGSAGVPTDHIQGHGAMVCALIEALRLMGLEVELHICYSVTGSRGTEHTTHVMVKRAGDIVDPDDIMLAVAYADVQRRLVFAVREREAPYMRDAIVGHSYGQGQDAPELLTEYLVPDVLISRPTEEGWMRTDAAKATWVLGKVNGLDFS